MSKHNQQKQKKEPILVSNRYQAYLGGIKAIITYKYNNQLHKLRRLNSKFPTNPCNISTTNPKTKGKPKSKVLNLHTTTIIIYT